MTVGAPHETKFDEYHLGRLPGSAHVLAADGHRMLVLRNAGSGIGFGNIHYELAGAETVDDAPNLYA